MSDAELFSDYDDSGGEDDPPSEQPFRAAVGPRRPPGIRHSTPPAEAVFICTETPPQDLGVVLSRIASSASVRCAVVATLDGFRTSHLVVRCHAR